MAPDDAPTPDAPESTLDPVADTPTDLAPADEPLGDGGKAALAAERKRAAAAEREKKALQKRLDALEEANLNEVDRAVKKARDEGAAEAIAMANERVIRSEVKAIATGKLADPADALAFLDMSTITVGDDGDVDAQAISTAIDELLQRKPHLAAAAKPATPGVPAGVRTGSHLPQLTAADLKTMSPEAIVEAKAKGQFDDLLGTR